MNQDNKHHNTSEPYLKVFRDRSVLITDKGLTQVFEEGRLTKSARARLKRIRTELGAGYLASVIEQCKKPDADLGELSPDHLALLEGLVNSLTSEVGRGLVGLTVIQLCVKSIVPEQSIRLSRSKIHSKGTTVAVI